MRFRILAAPLLALATLAPSAHARPVADAAPVQEPFVRARMGQLLEGLTLAPDQQTRVDSLVTSYLPKLPAALPDSTGDAALRRRVLGLLGELDQAVRVALTPEQQRVFDRNKADWERRMVGRHT